MPQYTYVTDVYPSPRDVNTVFVTLNNYQRGDFKPYIVRSTDRGRTWTAIGGDLPQRSGAWSIVQDHVNGNLLFAGMEFGVFFTVDGGSHWTQLRGGIPTSQARDLIIQKREGDLVVGTFGRGAYILDDYSALRDLTSEGLGTDARLFRLRDAYLFDELGQVRATWGDPVTPNPPFGAVFTYSAGRQPAGDAKLVLNITDEAGKPIRRLNVSKEPGVHRVAWDLRGEPPAPPATTEAGGESGGRGGRGGGAGGDQDTPQVGRGQARQGPLVTPGRYKASIGRVTGDTFSAIGDPQTFLVVPLPR